MNDFRPNILANYFFELANTFHAFYEACPVLKSEEPAREHSPGALRIDRPRFATRPRTSWNQGSRKDVDRHSCIIVTGIARAEGPVIERCELALTFIAADSSWRIGVRKSLRHDERPIPRIPSSTYRLQFNRQFTFAQAREIVPYLHALGISDCYASPYFQARAESLHGYDITDHNKLNAAIGSREEYDAWVAELHARGMGQMLDFVPNHMGIGEPLNQWWMDVLENGPSSLYAPLFRHRLASAQIGSARQGLAPDPGRSIRTRPRARRVARCTSRAGAFFFAITNTNFRSRPAPTGTSSRSRSNSCATIKDEEFYAEFQSILTALEYLPRRTETDPERIAERAREKEIIKRRLERRCQEAPQVQEAIEKALAIINGTPGDPRSFDALDALLNDQSYRLAFWRVAAEEINYRRFFDVNDLAAIRMELPEVFERRTGFCSSWSRPGRSRACASITPTGFICRTNISKNCSDVARRRWGFRCRTTGAPFISWSKKS